MDVTKKMNPCPCRLSDLEMAVDEKPNVQVPGSPALDTVKLDIRTIMANYSSNLISLNQLLREYEQTIGTKLPFRQFGYDSPMQFFQSLPDLVQVSGFSWTYFSFLRHYKGLLLNNKP